MPQKAKTTLKQTLILLLEAYEFDDLSISKICKEAGLNRSTFYAYYDNQYELLKDVQLYISEIFKQEFEDLLADQEETQTYDSFVDKRYLVPYLTYIKNHQKLYRIYLKHPHDLGREGDKSPLLENLITKSFHAHGVMDDREIQLTSAFYQAGINTVIKEWVFSNCQDDIEFIIQNMAYIY